ncbi:hypothetical protein [Nitrospirillum pindoramense]|uniref:Uncharacterized protein n=1 Tax=Nitrospirillum amazonense TaxID=28077 RepID=A0A560H2B8_9PROT|nr:hypothetical protein [Nitrospirillum amazonense]TWB40452.1 hypothetical protein FBZ90_10955 [Nitrospirillum amazonense]
MLATFRLWPGPVVGDRPQDLIEQKPKNEEVTAMRYALLWLLGVPLPVLIIIYLIFH